jgi:hypothetical protein
MGLDPGLCDFADNNMLQIIDFDHVYDFGLIQSKIIVIEGASLRCAHLLASN